MASLTNAIPEKTIERLSEYRRTLLASHKQGITHIFSHVLAGIHGITAVQVRRDLMLIGFSSDTKKGYDVQVLIEYISRILDSPSQMNIAVLGMGHLGQAITKYFNGKGLKLKITAAFDVDPGKVGKTIDGIPCYHMDTFEEIVEDKDISIVIVSSPTQVAPSLVVPIINAGIRGVLNFTSTPLNFPQGIVVENYDITTLLEKVAYFVKENEEKNSSNTPKKSGRRESNEGFSRFRSASAFHASGGDRRIVRRRAQRPSETAAHRDRRGPRAGRRKHRIHLRAASPHHARQGRRPAPADDARRENLPPRTAGDRQSGHHPFDRAFSRLAPDEFVRDCLVGHTGAETLVVGFNHRFGHNKQGSYDYLDSHGFGLRVIEVSECDVDAEKVSSTVIRRLVERAKWRAPRICCRTPIW